VSLRCRGPLQLRSRKEPPGCGRAPPFRHRLQNARFCCSTVCVCVCVCVRVRACVRVRVYAYACVCVQLRALLAELLLLLLPLLQLPTSVDHRHIFLWSSVGRSCPPPPSPRNTANMTARQITCQKDSQLPALFITSHSALFTSRTQRIRPSGRHRESSHDQPAAPHGLDYTQTSW
jgi:hypothetical protein